MLRAVVVRSPLVITLRAAAIRSPLVIVMACLILASGFVPTFVLGCGGNSRQQTLRTSLVAVNAARDGLVTWDEDHQSQIIAAATSKEEARAKLDTYRADRVKLVNAFEAVYRAIAVAAVAGDKASLDDALQASKKLLESLDKLQGGP